MRLPFRKFLRRVSIGDWLIVILLLLGNSLFAYYLWMPEFQDTHKMNQAQTLYVRIQQAKLPAKVYALNQQRLVRLQGKQGSVVIEISTGKARFKHSHCFSQQCVLHGWISRPGELNACLPNQISIQIIGKGLFDAINY